MREKTVRDHIREAERLERLGRPTDLLRANIHASLAVAKALTGQATAEQGAVLAPVRRLPTRADTPNTTSTPADAPAEADQNGTN